MYREGVSCWHGVGRLGRESLLGNRQGHRPNDPRVQAHFEKKNPTLKPENREKCKKEKNNNSRFDIRMFLVLERKHGFVEQHSLILLGKHLHQALHKVLLKRGKKIRSDFCLSPQKEERPTRISSQTSSSPSNVVSVCCIGTIKQWPSTSSSV